VREVKNMTDTGCEDLAAEFWLGWRPPSWTAGEREQFERLELHEKRKAAQQLVPHGWPQRADGRAVVIASDLRGGGVHARIEHA
jgi:hypothetical protein